MASETLKRVCFFHPAIDNHAHPLLTAANRAAVPFEGLVSEAEGSALADAPTTLACFRATADLAALFGLPPDTTWDAVKAHRAQLPYDELCRLSFGAARIQCVLLDDGLGGVETLCEPYRWHDQFTTSAVKRIVRVEVVAQDILQDMFAQHAAHGAQEVTRLVAAPFRERLVAALTTAARDPEVVGFKSVACYRTGLDISPDACSDDELAGALAPVWVRFRESSTRIRLAEKVVNDFVVRTTLEIAGACWKPVQFHTGLGDADIALARSSPAHMQPLLAKYTDARIVLLHSSYPYTRDAGYLAAVYKNVYLDFGEVFPFLAAHGQEAVVRQVLELAPTSKIMWSTDGHWWPESYYLGTQQAREALYKVLEEFVLARRLSEKQAIQVAKSALFDNANRVYNLGLTADMNFLDE